MPEGPTTRRESASSGTCARPLPLSIPPKPPKEVPLMIALFGHGLYIHGMYGHGLVTLLAWFGHGL